MEKLPERHQHKNQQLLNPGLVPPDTKYSKTFRFLTYVRLFNQSSTWAGMEIKHQQSHSIALRLACYSYLPLWWHAESNINTPHHDFYIEMIGFCLLVNPLINTVHLHTCPMFVKNCFLTVNASLWRSVCRSSSSMSPSWVSR